MAYTSMEQLPKIHDELNQTFLSGITLPIEWRQNQLRQLAKMFLENHKAFADSILKDLGRPYMETYSVEISGCVNRATAAADMLPTWAAATDLSDAVAPIYKAWTPKTVKHPKGVGLVITPWNYPIFLSAVPLIGAIAAGCCCVVKLSEISPHFSDVMAGLLQQYLDPRAFRVVLGAIPETTRLLELKWDHRNTSVGRIVARAAAEHLTPITLELGGKCPVIVDPSYDLDVAARRILMGKCSNAGQICVTPDYLVIPRSSREAVVAALQRASAQFFPDGALKSDSYSRIVSTAHYQRSKRTVVMGGKTDESTRGMEPTVLVDIEEDDVLLQEEIFGPILPILEVDNFEDAVSYIRKRPYPLAVYAFTENQSLKDMISSRTMSGSVCFNGVFLQLGIQELPYGGVGESGSGRCNIPAVMDEFAYVRSSIDIPAAIDAHLGPFYPPYTEEDLKMVNANGFEKVWRSFSLNALAIDQF
ncbi:aldehyde dehydrogenase [Hymenopellis radicata]|nr:aldehyde dehydrogenase [Hymenopellis radicata]